MLELLRLEYGDDKETIGALLIGGRLFCVTLELPWRDNQQNQSCIPAGRYEIKHHQSPSNGHVLAFDHVDNREDIQIHAGNTAKETTGCILVGLYPGYLDGKRAVMKSRIAMETLLERLEVHEVMEIRVGYGGF